MRALAAALMLCGCAGAEVGAARVQGSLRDGAGASAAFEFFGSAEVHAAGPLRIEVRDEQAQRGQHGREGLLIGRSIELRLLSLPDSGAAVDLASTIGARGQVRLVAAGEAEPVAGAEGERLWSDGSFTRDVGGGTLTLSYGGRRPGDGVTGAFELRLGDERLSGELAAAFWD